MIFGKTFKQKSLKKQERLRFLFTNREKKFALFPVQLENGKFAWMQWVFKEHNVRYTFSHCWPFSIDTYYECKYFLEQYTAEEVEKKVKEIKPYDYFSLGITPPIKQ